MNFEELLKLCEEYEMEWLTQIIDGYLARTKMFSTQRAKAQMAGLKLADKFGLHVLRKNIISISHNVITLQKEEGFDDLTNSTKYQLARKEISQKWSYNRYSKNRELTREDIDKDNNIALEVLDEYFKDV